MRLGLPASGPRPGDDRPPRGAGRRGQGFPLPAFRAEHRVGEHLVGVPALHVAVVMALATREPVDEKQALQHRDEVAIAHQRTGDPDLPVHGDAVGARELPGLPLDPMLRGEPVEVDDLAVARPVAGREDQVRPPLLRHAVPLAVGFIQPRAVVQGRYLDDADPQRLDDRARVLVHDAVGRTGKLDAVAVHDEGDRRPGDVGDVEPVERLPRHPAGVAAVGDYPGAAVAGALAEGLPDGDRNHHPEAAAVELGPPGQPGDVPGKVQAAAEALDNRLFPDVAEGGEAGVVADAGMGVLDRVLDALVVGAAQRQQQAGNQLEAAAEVIELADGGQGGERTDRRAGGLDLQGFEKVGLGPGQLLLGIDVDLQRQHLGGHLRSEMAG